MYDLPQDESVFLKSNLNVRWLVKGIDHEPEKIKGLIMSETSQIYE